jgi:hypothetical protein
MKHLSKFALCALVIGATVFTSCNDDDEETPVATPSIYARLGGTAMVSDPRNPGQMIESGRLAYRSVVDTTINLIVADIVAGNQGNLGAHFAPVAGEVFGTPSNTTGVAILSDNLTDFFSFNTGGTNAVNTYTGLNMVAAHNPSQNPRMGAFSTNANYDRFVGFVGQAAIKNGVPANSQLLTDIGAVLESLRDPIVQP